MELEVVSNLNGTSQQMDVVSVFGGGIWVFLSYQHKEQNGHERPPNGLRNQGQKENGVPVVSWEQS